MLKNKIAAIHQPDFLSYLGFFKKMSNSDLFIYLDDVEISKGGVTNRDRIKTIKGQEWITVDLKKFKKKELIKNIEISYDNDWSQRSLNLIEENYTKSKYYDQIFPIISEIFSFKPKYLIEFNIRSIDIIKRELNIKNKSTFSSKFVLKEKKSSMLVEILKKNDIKNYLSGIGAKNYLDLNLFKKNNIKVLWNNFEHPIYDQQFDGFTKNLSIIDYLFNCGVKNAINYFKRDI